LLIVTNRKAAEEKLPCMRLRSVDVLYDVQERTLLLQSCICVHEILWQ